MYSKELKKSPESNPGWILLPEQMDVLSKKPYTYNATAGSFLELLFLQKYAFIYHLNCFLKVEIAAIYYLI